MDSKSEKSLRIRIQGYDGIIYLQTLRVNKINYSSAIGPNGPGHMLSAVLTAWNFVFFKLSQESNLPWKCECYGVDDVSGDFSDNGDWFSCRKRSELVWGLEPGGHVPRGMTSIPLDIFGKTVPTPPVVLAIKLPRNNRWKYLNPHLTRGRHVADKGHEVRTTD